MTIFNFPASLKPQMMTFKILLETLHGVLFKITADPVIAQLVDPVYPDLKLAEQE